MSLKKFDDVERKFFNELDLWVADTVSPVQLSDWVVKSDYFSRLLGWSRVRRVLSRLLNSLGFSRYSKRQAMIRNVVECESHREALETYWSDTGMVSRKGNKF